MSPLAATSRHPHKTRWLNLTAIDHASVSRQPYPHLIAHGVLAPETAKAINRDFPDISKTGFLPLDVLKRHGAFDELLRDLESPELADVLSRKLDIELRDKPSMITIRKWSAMKDGRIHNDGEAKIVTALLYLNETWPENEDGGRFRVLTSDRSFDDTAAEVPPSYGTFVAFVRTENSWHGHKPFEGERRVVQTTWLRSWEDLERKKKRGRLSFLLKKFRRNEY